MNTDASFVFGESTHVATSSSQTRPIGSIWRRLLAYLTDSFFLGIVGVGLGHVLFDTLSQIGPWGRLVGFCIALAYFAPLDSSLGSGQTLGKRWLKLRVVDAHGSAISFGKSLARYVLFAIPCFLFDIKLSLTRTPSVVSYLILFIVYGIGGTTIYLILFNPDTRQGLHDLLVGSYVVDAVSAGPVEAKPIRKMHWVILGALFVVSAVGVGIFHSKIEESTHFRQMRSDTRLIEQMGGVERGSVRDWLSYNRKSGEARKVLVVSIVLTRPTADQESFASRAAGFVLLNDRYARDYDQLSIRLFYGYDMGIASHWDHQEFVHSPAEWDQLAPGVSPATSRAPLQ